MSDLRDLRSPIEAIILVFLKPSPNAQTRVAARRTRVALGRRVRRVIILRSSVLASICGHFRTVLQGRRVSDAPRRLAPRSAKQRAKKLTKPAGLIGFLHHRYSFHTTHYEENHPS